MTQEELDILQNSYGFNILTFEERRSMGLEGFRDWCKSHVIPIPKSELKEGMFYHGCVQGGRVYHMMWTGDRFQKGINGDAIYYHYEDSSSADAFVPFKLI